MNKIIVMAVLTALVNPILYGMDAKNRTDGAVRTVVLGHLEGRNQRRKSFRMSENDQRMLVFCRFQAQNRDKIQGISWEDLDEARRDFIMHDTIKHDQTGLLLHDFDMSRAH